MSVLTCRQAFIAGWHACQNYAPQDMPSDDDVGRMFDSMFSTHAVEEPCVHEFVPSTVGPPKCWRCGVVKLVRRTNNAGLASFGEDSQ
jgi:hypothetical protein